jgi:tRNA pseudouridine55 synthase
MAYGLLNVFKPTGPTSHDIVAAVRRGTGERRIGHAGTLDPLADGVLVLALGKATRLIEYLTYDVQGEVVARRDNVPHPTLTDVQAALGGFSGTILQRPPVYSAIKVGGKPAYARARAGEALELAAREVTIHELTIAAYTYPLLEIAVACSAGTYIRSLAHDLGQGLGCGAALSKLRRTASGDFRAEDAVPWDELTRAFEGASWEQYLIPADRGASSLPPLTVDQAEIDDITHGRAIKASGIPSGSCRAYSSAGELIAILSAGSGDGLWYPHKVLVEHQTGAN